MTAPPRRRFRWSLRTIFVVVTVLCVSLGWQMNIVHQRETMRARIQDEGGFVEIWVRPEPIIQKFESGLELAITSYQRSGGPEHEPEIPRWRRWLGDEAFNHVILPSGWPESELVRTRAIFPEALVEPALPPSDWDELQIRGTRRMQQRQAERIGIAGPMDRAREAHWDQQATH